MPYDMTVTNESEPLLRDHVDNSTYLPWDPRRAKFAGIVILASITLERLAYYALVMNFFFYLNKGRSEVQSWNTLEAMTAIYVLYGIAYVSSPLAGWLSDSCLGRFKAIVIGYILYITGFGLLTALTTNAFAEWGCSVSANHNGTIDPSNSPKLRSYFQSHFAVPSSLLKTSAESVDSASPPCQIHVYVIITLIGLAVGFVRSNIHAFGAEQTRAGGETSVRKFFTWYYWCANFGSFVGVAVLSFVDEYYTFGFMVAYGTCTVALFSALIIFIAGRRFYIVHRPQGSLLTNLVCIIFQGLKSRCRTSESLQSSPLIRRRSTVPSPSPTWLDYAKLQFGGKYHGATVDDVRKFGKIVLFFAILMPYWLVYFQMSTSFQAQGLHMRISYGEGEKLFRVPAPWLTLFNQAFILVSVPLLNGVVYPYLDKKRLTPSNRERIMFGMLASVLASGLAGIVEHFRLNVWKKGSQLSQNISGTVYDAADLAIWWQIPQYCMVGAAEVFAGVAGLEFAYCSSPKALQGLVMGLYSAMEGIGSFLGVALVGLMANSGLNWIATNENFNDGHMDFFCYTLSLIQTIALLIFLCITPVCNEPREDDTGVKDLEASLAVSVGSFDIPTNFIPGYRTEVRRKVRRGLDTHNSV